MERNLKGKNLEISRVPFKENENVVDLAVKVVNNIDSELSQDDIDYARRFMKKDYNNAVTYGLILVGFKSMSKIYFIFRKKKTLKLLRMLS